MRGTGLGGFLSSKSQAQVISKESRSHLMCLCMWCACASYKASHPLSCDSGEVTLCLSSSVLIQGLCGVVKSTNCPLTCNEYVAIEALIIITMC